MWTVFFVILEYLSFFYIIYQCELMRSGIWNKVFKISILSVICLICIHRGNINSEILGTLFAFPAVYIVFEMPFVKKVLYFLVAFNILSLLSSSMEFLVDTIINRSIFPPYMYHIILITLCWIIFLFLMKNSDQGVFSLDGEFGVCILLHYSLVTLLITSFQYVLRNVIQNQVIKISCSYFAGIGGITMSISFFVLLYFRNRKIKNQQIIRELELFGEIERAHFQKQLDREYETRRFRHDYVAFLVALKEILEQGQCERAENYILEMQKELDRAIGKNYYVGNDLIDAILNYYLNDLSDVRISVSGNAGCVKGVLESDLTVIISNMVRNAVEAVSLQDKMDKYIVIECEANSDEFCFFVNNSFTPTEEMRQNLKSYQQKQVKHYGLGINNIQSVVKKYGGKLFISNTNEDYLVKLWLPIRQ